MADADWKKRVGIPINYSSSGEEDEEEDDDLKVEYRKKDVVPDVSRSLDVDSIERVTSTEELLQKYEEYGSTPPRTRMKIKIRDWDRKQKSDINVNVKPKCCGTRFARSRANRRNTVDCAILNEMYIDDDSKTPKTSDKRSQHLIRESERDFKRSSMILGGNNGGPLEAFNNKVDVSKLGGSFEERAESMPAPRVTGNMLALVPKLIETCNRYMSVTSRQVGCRTSAPPLAFDIKAPACPYDRSKLQTRRDFHETFANLIKLGSSVDKHDSKISQEDFTYQTELKDLIWLELQAWHADRSLDQQDKYLYTARQGVPDLLEKILNYKFQPKYGRELSVVSNDSGNVSDNTSHSAESNEIPIIVNKTVQCSECFSLYCENCQLQQTVALREVEELLVRLEAAEALYPSSQVMGSCHPIYKSDELVGRIKAMCLWYNITKHQRLKMAMVGKLFMKLQGKDFKWPWPMALNDNLSDSSTSSSAPENDDSGRDSVDSKQSIVNNIKSVPKVRFEVIDSVDSASSTSPADSVSSNDSATTKEPLPSPQQPLPPPPPPLPVLHGIEFDTNTTYARYWNETDFSIEPFRSDNGKPNSSNTPYYRRYIEHILKARGLGKSLNFLHKLYNVVLRKAQITLEKPGTEDFESDMDVFDGNDESTDATFSRIIQPIEKEQIEELRRYGAWSPEAQALALPSYAPTFVFLSVIPLEIMQEYLRMRIELRPPTPNPLSLEQLMKELREGLILAMTHRERFYKHVQTACMDKTVVFDKLSSVLEQFDATVKQVFELYLEYVEQWILKAAPKDHRKTALNNEWTFTKLISPMIAGQHSVAARKFCSIVGDLLKSIGNGLLNRAQELDAQIDDNPENADDEARKWQIFTICREIQTVFTVERENSIKILNFAKCFCRDLELADFHRDHNNDDGRFVMCEEVKEAVRSLQKNVLNVRHKLTKVIEHVQDRCDLKQLGEIDETDRLAIVTRTREILHQGFKFGFDYHKEIVRLFETKIVSCKDKSCEFNLSLGIIYFAKLWMVFVTTKCERGRGVRPRWAAQGLEFLIAACDPANTKHLTEEEFDDLKSKMDDCISHVVGIISEPEKTRKRSSPRSRKVSPAPNRAITPTRAALSPRLAANSEEQKLYLHQLSLIDDSSPSPLSAPNTPLLMRKQNSCESNEPQTITLKVPNLLNNRYSPALRQIRVRDAVNKLDLELETKLRKSNLIGQVKTLNNSDKIHIRARTVTFGWHRGIKIGQGRFGKVYIAVNNSTNELMAMKEITIQPNETRAIKNVAEELKIFEGISHKYLVKYYGVEIHREELLIFMELCSEGTLESLVELSGGLFEGLTRRFTAQLLSAVIELHKHGVVHRDIKTANIFLTNGGNSLKLGDFGSAVKIQAHTTVPGELQGYVGTQAYMAPEVFTKTNSDGHGRAADIWSVGCVVIEMASGKRPWAQFDSNFQIMFKVGMGETPEIPASLSHEGHDFIEHCLEHDPKLRWNSIELIQHNFCKVDLNNDTDDYEPKSTKKDNRRNLARKPHIIKK